MEVTFPGPLYNVVLEQERHGIADGCTRFYGVTGNARNRGSGRQVASNIAKLPELLKR